jgi:uncharacterized protein (TIGR03067 family)
MKHLTAMICWGSAILLGVSGCSSLSHNDVSAIQGSWTGHEIGADPDSPRHIMFSGNSFEYRGAEADDWAKGTFTLRQDIRPKRLLIVLKDCGPAQYAGKTCYVIYKIEDGTLALAGSEPGDPEPPADFDAQGARHMVFKKE